MTTEHSITPPRELVQQWRKSGPADAAANNAYELHIATQAARWGSDQELEACCKWLPKLPPWSADDLRRHRRPKPPSLKELALAVLENKPEADDMKELVVFDVDQVEIIRKALEQLDD